MTLVIDEVGAFWGGFDADCGFMGDGIADVVHALLVEPGSRRFDREVADRSRCTKGVGGLCGSGPCVRSSRVTIQGVKRVARRDR